MKKWTDLIIISIMFIIEIILSLHFKFNYLITTLLFLGLPSVYLTLRKKIIFKKDLIYSVLISFPVVLVVNYITTVSDVWDDTTMFWGFRLLNAIHIETFIWAFLYSYFIIVFYEYFLHRDKKERTNKRLKNLVFILGAISFIFGVIYFLNKELLIIQHFYIIFVVLFFFIPTGSILIKYPKLIKNVTLESIYFVFFLLTYEIVAISLGLWSFPGNSYIGMVSVLGVTFPFEELLWILFCIPAFLCVYEFFDDKLE